MLLTGRSLVLRASTRVPVVSQRRTMFDKMKQKFEQLKAKGTSKPDASKPTTMIQNLPGVKHIVAVSSAKGGVGKSTCAVNLALSLSSLGLRTGLLDADVYGPSIPRMMNLLEEKADSGFNEQTETEYLIPVMNYDIKCMSIGFLIPRNQAVVWRGPMAVSAIHQMLHKVKWGEPDLDVLVVDFAPGTGDLQLSLAQTVPFTGSVIITTPQDIALEDVERGMNMFQKVKIIGIVENMSYYKCPKCGNVDHVFGDHGGEELSRAHSLPLLGKIPLNIKIRKHADEGKPIVVAEPQSEHSKVYLQIAQKVKESLEADNAVVAPKIVIE